MDTRQVIARFEQERQALAMMDHPNIAKVLDAGATASGRPYFVMELVRGESITKYCDKAKLTIHERLELFNAVCHAVQHAHTKGIIHRDIKPSNVLVTIVDSKPVPKVIDFGIAKATAGPLTDKTLFTEHRQMIGTPEYMSPEQAEMTASDIDTRSDVYALGVLMYELLTGVTPFDSRTLRSAAWAEMQRIIREDDPPRPSTRLTGSTGTLARVATERRVAPDRLGSLVRGDLDWIAMKCLEKDRTRRYTTPDQIAADIRKHFDGEPVEAAPPSQTYRARKFLRRNRRIVGTIAAVIIALAMGLTGTVYALVQARRERDAKGVALAAEAQQRIIATANEARAIAEAAAAKAARDEAEAVVGVQERQFTGIDVPSMAVLLRSELVERARAAGSRSRLSELEVQRKIQNLEDGLDGADVIGALLVVLDKEIFEDAIGSVRAGVGYPPLVKARLLQSLAQIQRGLGMLERAAALQSEVLALRSEHLGAEHSETLDAIAKLIAIQCDQSKFTDAERQCRDSVEIARRVLGEEHDTTVRLMAELGYVLKAQGNLSEAEPYYLKVLAARSAHSGVTSPAALNAMNNLGSLLEAQGRVTEAESYHRNVLSQRLLQSGPDDRLVLNSMNNLGHVLQLQGRWAEAKSLYLTALERRRRMLGNEHLDTLSSIINMGSLFMDAGRLDDAELYLRDAFQISRRVLGPDHRLALISTGMVGNWLVRKGRLSEAEPHLREAMEGLHEAFGDEHAETITATNGMGRLLLAQGKVDEAEVYCRKAMDLSQRKLGADHPLSLAAINALCDVLVTQGNHAEAITMLLSAEEVANRKLGPESPRRVSLITSIVALYDAWNAAEPTGGNAFKAAEWKAKLDAIKEAVQGRDVEK